MASSRQYLLPLLSGSAILCSLWAVQVPAQAQIETELPLSSLPEQVDTASPVQVDPATAAESTVAAALDSTSAEAVPPADLPVTVAPDAATAVAAPEVNEIAATPEIRAEETQIATPQTPASAQTQPFSPPTVDFTNPGPDTVDFNELGTSRLPQDLLTDYVLGPGDQILLLVLGYEEFEGARVVLPDGTITVPLIGSVPAAGRNVDALAQDVQNRLRVYLTDPVVDANLTVLRPVVVNIAGEVYRPGPVQLSSLTQVNTIVNPTANITNATNTPTLSSALTAAGGIKRSANIRNIVVQRRLPNGVTREFTINLWDALTNGQDPGIVVLADGDSVFVPVARSGEDLDPRLIASSSFAPTNVRVRVVGEVTRPGEVTVQPNSSISSAVAAAGGPIMDTAQLRDVTLVRLTEEGQIEKQTVDLSNLIDDYQIQDGDVVVVPKRGYLGALDAVGRIFSPLLAPFGIINTLNDLFFNND
ncbi:MAG: polysaccharide biosynthesis/export family protein [Cyanobacteria bacterium Co-bin13]|nr:polysaccharide biosynthesis/export family protein [Cyanobacteria bacterium Co-bin13]